MFYSFDFARDLVAIDKDEEEINTLTLGIEKQNKNDESDINEKDEESVISGNSIINETKELPVVIIDWFMIWRSIKKSKNGYSQI